MRSEMVRLQDRLEAKEGELEGMAQQMEDAVEKLSGDLGEKSEKVSTLHYDYEIVTPVVHGYRDTFVPQLTV